MSWETRERMVVTAEYTADFKMLHSGDEEVLFHQAVTLYASLAGLYFKC